MGREGERKGNGVGWYGETCRKAARMIDVPSCCCSCCPAASGQRYLMVISGSITVIINHRSAMYRVYSNKRLLLCCSGFLNTLLSITQTRFRECRDLLTECEMFVEYEVKV